MEMQYRLYPASIGAYHDTLPCYIVNSFGKFTANKFCINYVTICTVHQGLHNTPRVNLIQHIILFIHHLYSTCSTNLITWSGNLEFSESLSAFWTQISIKKLVPVYSMHTFTYWPISSVNSFTKISKSLFFRGSAPHPNEYCVNVASYSFIFRLFIFM